MSRFAVPLALALALALAAWPAAAAPQAPQPTQPSFILPYQKTPETPREFWAALKHELELGNQKRAADMFRGFWDKLNTLGEEEQANLLLNLYDTEGLSRFLRLANHPELRKLLGKDGEGQKELPIGDLLLGRVNRLVQARLGDAGRIRFLVENLGKSPGEKAYAIDQLRHSGPLAVPYLVEALRDPKRSRDHQAIEEALLKMNPNIAPPLLAALDCPDPYVRSAIIATFVRRGDNRIVPYLWYLSALKGKDDKVQREAAAALARFQGARPGSPSDPRELLTREAEKYYRRQVPGNGGTIWKWDDRAGLSGQAATPSQYEEHQGLSWARKALELDPGYRPAQIVLLSLLLDKAHERGGVEQSLAVTDPELHQLLAATSPELLEAVLQRALSEGRTAVALGAARALARSGDVRLLRGGDRGPSALARALNLGDRRVQLAAAEALLNVPSAERFPGSSRVIEILARALGTGGAPKVLLGIVDRDELQKLSAMFQGWGFDAVPASNGRDLLAKAQAAVDVELILLDPRLPEPGLAHLISGLRQAPETAGLPIVILSPRELEKTARAAAGKQPRVLVLAPPPASPELLKQELDPLLGEARLAPLSAAERQAMAKESLAWLGRIARGERKGLDLQPAEPALIRALDNNDLAAGAAEALAYLPGRRAQSALAQAVTNQTRPAAIRAAAAKELRLHLHRFGSLLTPEEGKKLVDLAGSAADPELKEEAARLSAILRADAATAGDRIRRFQPSPGPKPPAPKGGEEAPKPKDPPPAKG